MSYDKDKLTHKRPDSTPNHAAAWTLSTNWDDIEMSQVDSKWKKVESQWRKVES